MLKTISWEEFYFLHWILKSYFSHLQENWDSMITRFYGMYKMKYIEGSSTKRLYFIIMANVFSTQWSIQVRFDLKGSIQGRYTKPTGNSHVALKDKNFNDEEANKIDVPT